MSFQRNLSSQSNIQPCRTLKVASVFAQAGVQRELPQVEAIRSEALNIDDEEDNNVEEELTCFKGHVTVEKSQMELSSQQRDVTVLMADTPSPAPSVISIHSELTDGEDERDDEDPHLHA